MGKRRRIIVFSFTVALPLVRFGVRGRIDPVLCEKDAPFGWETGGAGVAWRHFRSPGGIHYTVFFVSETRLLLTGAYQVCLGRGGWVTISGDGDDDDDDGDGGSGGRWW